MVEYEYDAWDKPILMRTLTDIHEALAELNPFRYRGYVCDSELNLYYSQNRFCSIRWNRFINEDNLIRGNLYSLNWENHLAIRKRSMVSTALNTMSFYLTVADQAGRYCQALCAKEFAVRQDKLLGRAEICP